jgi:hypothetical protein
MVTWFPQRFKKEREKKRERIKIEIKDKEKVSVSKVLYKKGNELQLTWCSSESSVHHISRCFFLPSFSPKSTTSACDSLGLLFDFASLLSDCTHHAFFTYPTQPHPKHLRADHHSLWHNRSSTTIAAPVLALSGRQRASEVSGEVVIP